MVWFLFPLHTYVGAVAVRRHQRPSNMKHERNKKKSGDGGWRKLESMSEEAHIYFS